MAVRVILSCLQAEASFLKAVFWRKTRLSFLLCAAAIVKTRTGLFNLSNYREGAYYRGVLKPKNRSKSA